MATDADALKRRSDAVERFYPYVSSALKSYRRAVKPLGELLPAAGPPADPSMALRLSSVLTGLREAVRQTFERAMNARGGFMQKALGLAHSLHRKACDFPILIDEPLPPPGVLVSTSYAELVFRLVERLARLAPWLGDWAYSAPATGRRRMANPPTDATPLVEAFQSVAEAAATDFRALKPLLDAHRELVQALVNEEAGMDALEQSLALEWEHCRVAAPVQASAEADLRAWLHVVSELNGRTSKQPDVADGPAAEQRARSVTKKRKRSTVRGEAKEKLRAGLLKHHKYGSDDLYLEPVGCVELAQQVRVSRGSASAFFRQQYGSWGEYRAACHRAASSNVELRTFRASLKALDRGILPCHVLGIRRIEEDGAEE